MSLKFAGKVPWGEEEEERRARRAQGSCWEAAQYGFQLIGLGYHSQVWRQPRTHKQVVRCNSGLEPSVVLLGWGWVREAGDGWVLEKKARLGNVSDRKGFSWILPAFPG